MQGLGSGAISLAGSPDIKDRYCLASPLARPSPPSLSPKPRPARTSPRSAVAHVATATSTSSDGEKTWISNGGIAEFYCVFARTTDAEVRPDGTVAARGISAFVVDADAPGSLHRAPHRCDLPAPACRALLRRVPGSGLAPVGCGRRRLQAGDAHIECLPDLGRRRGTRLRAARAR